MADLDRFHCRSEKDSCNSLISLDEKICIMFDQGSTSILRNHKSESFSRYISIYLNPESLITAQFQVEIHKITSGWFI